MKTEEIIAGNRLLAGIGGAGLAVISYSVDLEKLFKNRKK